MKIITLLAGLLLPLSLVFAQGRSDEVSYFGIPLAGERFEKTVDLFSDGGFTVVNDTPGYVVLSGTLEGEPVRVLLKRKDGDVSSLRAEVPMKSEWSSMEAYYNKVRKSITAIYGGATWWQWGFDYDEEKMLRISDRQKLKYLQRGEAQVYTLWKVSDGDMRWSIEYSRKATPRFRCVYEVTLRNNNLILHQLEYNRNLL